MFSLDEKEQFPSLIGRRSFLVGSIAVGTALGLSYGTRNKPLRAEVASAGLPKSVEIVDFTNGGERIASVTRDRIVKTEEEWRKELSAASFEVTRHAGTERAYTNENPNKHEKGVFRCICCDTALFDSETKFDSRTGWPSFWAAIAKRMSGR